MNETIEMNTVEEVAETVEKKPYEFRRLKAEDIFPMATIIKKIGLGEFTDCFEKDSIKKMISSLTGEDDAGESASIVGISVVVEIANVIFGNMEKCENDIFKMLTRTSNLSEKEIRGLDMPVFVEMIVDFIKKEEFKDFIKVVSKFVR